MLRGRSAQRLAMRTSLRVVILVSIACALASCGSATGRATSDAGTDGSANLDGGGDASQVPVCAGLSAVQWSDDASGLCSAARAYVTCPGEGCLSNDPNECSGHADPTQCQDECPPDDFAVACRSGELLTDGGPQPQLPPGCRSAANAVELEFYCCPCGS